MSFIVQATFITIVNYGRNTFIVETTGFHLFLFFFPFSPQDTCTVTPLALLAGVNVIKPCFFVTPRE
jgi:hypothetical protein